MYCSLHIIGIFLGSLPTKPFFLIRGEYSFRRGGRQFWRRFAQNWRICQIFRIGTLCTECICGIVYTYICQIFARQLEFSSQTMYLIPLSKCFISVFQCCIKIEFQNGRSSWSIYAGKIHLSYIIVPSIDVTCTLQWLHVPIVSKCLNHRFISEGLRLVTLL